MSRRKNKLLLVVIPISLISLLLISLFGLFFFFPGKNQEFLTSKKNGYTFEATLYDKYGNPINPNTMQTAITQGGRAGIYYMSFRILGSNTGDVQLFNLSIKNANPIDFNESLKKNRISYDASLQPTLGSQQSNILLWNTAKSCLENENCASNEVCVGSPMSCKIDISSYLSSQTCIDFGQIPCNVSFNAYVEGSYYDAYGIQQAPVSTNVVLDLSFAPDQVIFRSTVEPFQGGDDYGIFDKKIAVDRNNENRLGAFVLENGFYGGNYYPTDFISKTPDGNLVYRCVDQTKVCISQSPTLDKTQPQSGILYWRYTNYTGTLPSANFTSIDPSEPYYSENCRWIKPCQEMYIVKVFQAVPTCSDGLKNQDETDIDCGGTTCNKCANTKICIGNSDCSSNYCLAGICADEPVQPPISGLIARYKFDDVNNLGLDSASTNSLFNSGITQSDDAMIGQSAFFDGTVQHYLNLSNSQLTSDFPAKVGTTNRNFSISAWIKLNSNGDTAYNNIKEIACKYNATTGGFTFDVQNGKLILSTYAPSTKILPSSTILSDGIWYHVVGVYNAIGSSNSKAYLYINGVLDNSSSKMNLMATTPLDFNIGRYTNKPSFLKYFHGNIDDVRVYNKVLNSTEVQAIYNDRT